MSAGSLKLNKLKYQRRHGWQSSNRDRLSKPVVESHNGVFLLRVLPALQGGKTTRKPARPGDRMKYVQKPSQLQWC